MEATARWFSDPAEMGDAWQGWDRLACSSDRPLAAPAIVGAWWARMRPPGAEMRILTIWEGEEMVGVLPLVRVGRRYSWAGGQVMPGEPLARPASRDRVARALAAELSRLRPRSLSIELVEIQDGAPSWSSLLSDVWPKPRLLFDRVHQVVAMPRVDFDEGSFAGWMAARSSKFRRDVNRRRRRLEEAGGTLRFSDPESLRDDVAELIRLHLGRQHEESAFSHPGAQEMFVDIGQELLPAGRFRLVCAELDGRMIGALLLFAAGSGPSAFASGFDDEFGDLSPVMVSFVRVLEDMAERGEQSLSLGAGGQPYKYRLATGEDELVRHYLVPVGPRSVGSLVGSAIRDRLQR